MLSTFRCLTNISNQISIRSELACSFLKSCPLNTAKWSVQSFGQKNFLHLYSPRRKDADRIERRRDALTSSKRKQDFSGEKFFEIDESIKSEMFPTFDLPVKIFDGVPFKDIPIVHVKATKNNTILGLTVKSIPKLQGSCGIEGFKNTRKGTNIAAQAAGVSFGLKAIKRGFKTIRVIVKGFGPGRLSALKGLQLGGLNIVSVTDKTQDTTSVRPKKQRRL